ncbi:hypothetical protein BH23CHL7_BH23CHL7_19590 [soil metagenome]
MNDRSDETFDPRIADWLEDGPDRAPEVVLQALAATLPSMSQRPSWRSDWRFPVMLRFASAAVVAGVVAIAAIAAFSRPPVGPGNPTAPIAQSPATTAPVTPTASPAEPTASPVPVPSPSATTMTYRALSTSDLRRRLPAGGYLVEQPFAAPFTVTLPGEWRFTALEENHVEFAHTGQGYPSDIGWLSILILDAVYPDPCDTEGGSLPIGSAVDDLVEGLTSMAHFEAELIREVSVNGLKGKAFVLGNSIDPIARGCSGGPMLWVGTYRQNGSPTNVGTTGGKFEHMWVLDVHGTAVLVIVGGNLGPSNLSTADLLVATLEFGEPLTGD